LRQEDGEEGGEKMEGTKEGNGEERWRNVCKGVSWSKERLLYCTAFPTFLGQPRILLCTRIIPLVELNETTWFVPKVDGTRLDMRARLGIKEKEGAITSTEQCKRGTKDSRTKDKYDSAEAGRRHNCKSFTVFAGSAV
jgi:hypothetical protein